MNAAFAVSIVSPVYNVAPYLHDFLRSIERQDLGFRRNIQLVLVDDGSTDGSGEICDAFARRHPDNVAVLHQANAGQATARKAGLALATGRIVNFCDSDDKLSRNACRKALAMLDAHPDVDVAAIPIFFFGSLHGPHPLNGKFADGPRVVDLATEYGIGAINLPTTFIRRTALAAFDADPALVTAEDAKELFRVLLANPRLALEPRARYLYRKRPGSTLATRKFRKEAYLPVLEGFIEWVIAESRRLHGRLLPFVEYTLIYDLAGRFGAPPGGTLSPMELEEFRNRILADLRQFSDDAISRHDRLDSFQKIFLLSQKRDLPPRLVPSRDAPSLDLDFGDGFRYSGMLADCFVFKLDPRPEGFLFHAVLVAPCLKDIPAPALVATTPWNETVFKRTGHQPNGECCGRSVSTAQCVSGLVACERKSGFSISFTVRFQGNPDIPVSVWYWDFAPLTRIVQNSFFRSGDRILRPTPTGIRVEPASFLRHLVSELAFDWALLRSPNREEKLAVFFRWAFYFLKPFAPRHVWLVTDRMERADDNGLALFEYLMKHRKELGVRPKFVIHPKSPDMERIRKIGPVVPFKPVRYRLSSLLSDWTVSSQVEPFIRKPFLKQQYLFNDLFHSHQYAFLQHGITQNNVSMLFARAVQDMSIFVTASPRERDAILSRDMYDYTSDEVVLTGFPRFDKLEDRTAKTITFMPTWRSRLFGPVDFETGIRPLLPEFEQDIWYKSIRSVLTSCRFLDEADRLGYRVRFLPHPTFVGQTDRFSFDSRVVILGPETSYRDVFAESALCVTDYSSAVFDFVYLGKPVIYCQTDEIHYDRGYFDYDRDGFGPVVHETESLVDILIESIHKGCPLEEPYRSRVDAFFAFRDKRNCQRVTEAILATDRRINGFTDSDRA